MSGDDAKAQFSRTGALDIRWRCRSLCNKTISNSNDVKHKVYQCRLTLLVLLPDCLFSQVVDLYKEPIKELVAVRLLADYRATNDERQWQLAVSLSNHKVLKIVALENDSYGVAHAPLSCPVLAV